MDNGKHERDDDEVLAVKIIDTGEDIQKLFNSMEGSS
jgi:hypothetical protein